MKCIECFQISKDCVGKIGEPSTLQRPNLTNDLAVLGHEIRNPLSALTYALEAWPDGDQDRELEQNLLEIMHRQVKQLTRICNDLLDTSTCTKSSLSIHRTLVDIREAIENAIEEVRPFADSYGHTLAIESDSLPFVVFGDESRLTQVFANLMHNAVKFTDRGGQIHVSIERDHDAVVVRLRDDGRGISPDRLNGVFDTDTKACKKLGEVTGKGFGIGLRLAKAIIELHDGTIEAQSAGLGHGSTFIVRIPLSGSSETDFLETPPIELLESKEHSPDIPIFRILVVDDDRSIRFLVSTLLRKMHQVVSIAESGEKAIELIEQSQPDVVILDLQMGGMDGFEVARQIRAKVDLQNVVLIALSGSSDAASRKRAADSGFDQYMVKPVGLTELTNKLLHIARAALCSKW